jgi:site-specific recombinase XerD
LKERTSVIGPNAQFVFLNNWGLPITAARKLSRKFAPIRKRLQLEGCQIYGMRHTFATRLAESHENAEVIRQLLGHSSIRTTQQYMDQVSSEVLRDTVSRVTKKRKLV